MTFFLRIQVTPSTINTQNSGALDSSGGEDRGKQEQRIDIELVKRCWAESVHGGDGTGKRSSTSNQRNNMEPRGLQEAERAGVRV